MCDRVLKSHVFPLWGDSHQPQFRRGFIHRRIPVMIPSPHFHATNLLGFSQKNLSGEEREPKNFHKYGSILELICKLPTPEVWQFTPENGGFRKTILSFWVERQFFRVELLNFGWFAIHKSSPELVVRPSGEPGVEKYGYMPVYSYIFEAGCVDCFGATGSIVGL